MCLTSFGHWFLKLSKIYSSFRPVANLGSQLRTSSNVLGVVVMRHNILSAVAFAGAAQFYWSRVWAVPPLVLCMVLRVGNVDVFIWYKFTRVVGCSLSSQLHGVCRVGHDTG